MWKKNKRPKDITIILVIIVIIGIIFLYQTQKVGFHEDEIYAVTSSINPNNGLMSAYEGTEVDLSENAKPVWKTKEYVKSQMTLSENNYWNIKSIYINQAKDNHPPFFYILVHFASIISGGIFTKYTVFLVNITAFIISCFVINKILDLLERENLIIPVLIFYGLSMGTISMVIYQRMYMLLTLFILMYFGYSLKIYKNNFEINSKDYIILGVITVLGFLTQYFFAIYAVLIFAIILIKMIHQKKYKIVSKYVRMHIIYAIIGVVLFIPCFSHLIYSKRGITNLDRGNYLEHLFSYINHLLYAFTLNNNLPTIILLLLALILGIVYAIKKSKEKFVMLLTTFPSIIYFLIVVKLTSYQELRYIMPIIPFVSIIIFLILDSIMNFKYKSAIMVAIAVILSANGLIFSSPKFLFREYEECLEIAETNKDKSFVYVYDNYFNHIQSIPEMMIYEKTMIVDATRNQLQVVINDEKLNSENSYILSIKTYMDNDTILNEIKENTDFRNITKLYSGSNSSETISNNIYLVAK